MLRRISLRVQTHTTIDFKKGVEVVWAEQSLAMPTQKEIKIRKESEQALNWWSLHQKMKETKSGF